MAAIRTLEDVALPEQAVGMHVGDVEHFLQRLSGWRDAERNRHDPVLAALDVGGGVRSGLTDGENGRNERRTNPDPFFHGQCLSISATDAQVFGRAMYYSRAMFGSSALKSSQSI